MSIIKLPTEILQDIAYYLSIKEIATCQMVCRVWYKKWIAFTYDSVQINGKTQFQNFVRHTLKDSIYPPGNEFYTGNNIRKLVIENGYIKPSNLGQLPLLCPYLEIFMFDGIILSDEARKEMSQHYQQRRHREELNKIQHNFFHWKNMRQIVEFNGITVAHSLLDIQHQLNHQCQLTHISVQFNNSNDRTNSKTSFIKLLTNAPLLESLTIGNIYLSVTELEQIHENCPKLFSIHLIGTILLPMEIGFSIEDIEPASNMNNFHIVDDSCCENIPHWLEYISRKYINIRILDIGSRSFKPEHDNSSNNVDNTVTNDTYQKQLLQIAARCRRLNALKLLNFTLDSSFFDILDQKGTFLADLSLGDGLSTSGLHTLMQSQQRHYISSLTIDCSSLVNSASNTLVIVQTIIQCRNVETLHLSMGRFMYNDSTHLTSSRDNSRTIDNDTLYFDLILENCPKLISLIVTNAKLMITRNHTEYVSSPCFPLQSLSLENVLFDSNGIFNIIRSKCLVLDKVSLTATIPYSDTLDSRHLNIYLPRHQLKMLVLDRIRISKKCSIRLGTSRFKITNSLETIWYDLVEYECCSMHLSSVPSLISNSKHGIHISSLSSERMRAKKAKITTHNADCLSDYNLNQSVYVAVQCKNIQSIYLSGLQVI